MRFRFLSYLLVALGIAVMASPWVMEWKADKELEALLQEAERQEAALSLTPVAGPGLVDGYMRVSRLLGEGSERSQEEAQQPADAANSAPSADTDSIDDKIRQRAIATIEIASIGVKLPVLEGATEANMARAAAHMTETAPLGEVGNAAIAAHRARTKGRLFNRLDEVKEGDEIVIRTAGQTYVYTVTKQWIVKPDDVSVLDNNGDDKLLTLITCDPIVNATHRLIVQAKMK